MVRQRSLALNQAQKRAVPLGLGKGSLGRAQRGRAVEVYAELVGTLERELFAQAMKLASVIKSEPRAGSVSRGLLAAQATEAWFGIWINPRERSGR